MAREKAIDQITPENKKELENKLSDDEEVLIFHYRKLTIEQRHILLDQLSFGAYRPIIKE